MREINDTTKREEVVDIFKKGKFEFLALTETKLKGKREVSWCEVNGIIFGVQEMERCVERCVAQCSGVLAQEFPGLNSSFQGLRFVW